MRNILIIRFSSIGDIILTTPVLNALRQHYPDAQIYYLTKKQFAPLVANHPAVDHVVAFDKLQGKKPLKAIINQLKHQKFDLIADLHNNLRSKQVRWQLKAPLKTVFGKDYLRRWLFIITRISFYTREVPVRHRYFKGLSPLGIEPGQATTSLHPTAHEQATAHEHLRQQGIAQGTPYVVLAPGASYANKQWPTQHYLLLAKQWQSQDTQVVLAGGPTDVAVCQHLTQQAPGAVSLAGKLGLMASAALLQGAKLVYANDSGLMHMAQAVGTPVVAFFGPTTWHLGYMPMPKQATVLQVPNLWCRPCTHNGRHQCPLGHHKCLTQIQPATAFEAGAQLIQP